MVSSIERLHAISPILIKFPKKNCMQFWTEAISGFQVKLLIISRAFFAQDQVTTIFLNFLLINCASSSPVSATFLYHSKAIILFYTCPKLISMSDIIHSDHVSLFCRCQHPSKTKLWINWNCHWWTIS